jgi:hypothetical protein
MRRDDQLRLLQLSPNLRRRRHIECLRLQADLSLVSNERGERWMRRNMCDELFNVVQRRRVHAAADLRLQLRNLLAPGRMQQHSGYEGL